MFAIKLLFQFLVVVAVILAVPAAVSGFFYFSTAFIRWDLDLWDRAADYWRAIYWFALVTFLAVIVKKGVFE